MARTRKPVTKKAQRAKKEAQNVLSKLPSSESTLAAEINKIQPENPRTYTTESILTHQFVGRQLWLEIGWASTWELEEDLNKVAWPHRIIGSKIDKGQVVKYIEWESTWEPEIKLRKFEPEEDGDDINEVIDDYIAEFVNKKSAPASSRSKVLAKKTKTGPKKSVMKKEKL